MAAGVIAEENITKTKMRSILLQGEVNEDMFKYIYNETVRFLDISHKPIHLIIDTYGGYIDSMIAIHDYLMNLPCKVKTSGYGKVMSAGVLLLMCGEKGFRELSKNTSVMIHEVSSCFWGKTTDMESDITETRRLQNLMFELYEKYTGKPVNEWKALIERKPDLFITAEKAIEYGIADSISSSLFGLSKSE